MFQKILVPLDGSEFSEKSLLYGRVLAKQLNSEIILLHVSNPEHKQYLHIQQLYLERMAEILMGQAKNIDGYDIKVSQFTEIGDPYEYIVSTVQKNNVDLILMTSVGYNFKASGMGGVTERVCRAVPVPVMILKPAFFNQHENKGIVIRNVFIPIDGSSLSRLALPWSEGLAREFKANMTIFQMAQLIRPNISADTIEGIDFVKLSEVEERRVNSEMNELSDDIKQKGIKVSTRVVVGYDGASEIIEASKKSEADIVVMSTHGRSGIGRWVYGSVAGKVMHQIEIPLLLINPRNG